MLSSSLPVARARKDGQSSKLLDYYNSSWWSYKLRKKRLHFQVLSYEEKRLLSFSCRPQSSYAGNFIPKTIMLSWHFDICPNIMTDQDNSWVGRLTVSIITKSWVTRICRPWEALGLKTLPFSYWLLTAAILERTKPPPVLPTAPPALP